MKARIRRCIATLLALSILALGLQSVAARAEMISTGATLAAGPTAVSQAGLQTLFEREDVRQQLVDLGIDPQAASERVQRLTPAELAALNGRIAQAPAGGSVVGVALIVLLTLVFLDIFGVTDIFTFIKPAK